MRYSLAELPKSSKRYYVLAWCSAALLLIAAVLLVFLWRSQSVRIYSVQSASMEPYIQVGDAVLVRPFNQAIIKSGDVVTYKDPRDSQLLITHRVISFDRSTSMVTVKGDANLIHDKPLHASLIVGKVSAVTPKAGYIIDVLRTPAGLLVGIYVPAMIVLISEIRRLGQYYSRATYHLNYRLRNS